VLEEEFDAPLRAALNLRQAFSCGRDCAAVAALVPAEGRGTPQVGNAQLELRLWLANLLLTVGKEARLTVPELLEALSPGSNSLWRRQPLGVALKRVLASVALATRRHRECA
jgi:hypothetical protein